MKNTRLHGLTVIELMVSVAIIATLTAMVAPSLKESKNQADRVHCVNNLRQLGVAYRMFLDENNGAFPVQKIVSPTVLYGWVEAVKPFLKQNGAYSEDGNKDIFFCPDNKEAVGDSATFPNLQTSYATNYKCEDFSPKDVPNSGGGYTEGYIANQSDFVLLMDMCKDSKSRWWGDLGGSPNKKNCFIHNGKVNCLFFDGHVATMEKGAFTYKNTCFKGDWEDYWYHHDDENMN